jgi:hypothetical protein
LKTRSNPACKAGALPTELTARFVIANRLLKQL